MSSKSVSLKGGYQRRCSLKEPYNNLLETLTPQDLDEDVVRKLESVDPLAPKAESVFHSISGATVPALNVPCVTLLHLPSAAVNIESPEILECGETIDAFAINIRTDEPSSEPSLDVNAEEDLFTAHFSLASAKKHNAFTSLERDTQSKNPFPECRESQTIQPTTGELSGAFSRSSIYDAYRIASNSKTSEGMRALALKKGGYPEPDSTDEPDWSAIARKLKVLERVISHIIFSEVALDFRYYDEPVDDPREGSLLPLCRFGLKGITMPATDLQWNSEFPDLLAVTYGSYEYQVSGLTGAFAIFSTKNMLYPEYLWTTPVPAQCVAIHPRHSRLAAIGLYDGNICVYDIPSGHRDPEIMSDSSNKHDSGVQDIRWKDDDELSLYTVSCDGMVKLWLMKNTRLDAMVLFKIPANMRGPTPELVRLNITGSGFCMEFHPTREDIYLVGTRRGHVLKCSTEIICACLFDYDAHDSVVLSVKYNPYNPKIFLSCSADWMVCLWQDERSEPLLEFNLERQVTDVAWAPYSSTVFAACTLDGAVHVFDLNIDRFHSICTQKVISKQIPRSRPTRLVFNPVEPIIVVGDSNGKIRYLKLSSHLRIPSKASKKETLDQLQLEINKLLKVLSFMKPETLEYVPDLSCIPNS